MTGFGGAYGLLVAALFIGFAACGGGGGGGSTTTSTTTSGGTTAVTRGAVTAFGSVDIGNDRFLTTAATIRKRLDDNTANIVGDDNVVFRTGMIVQVFHNANDNAAAEIRFKDDLEGPVTSIAGTVPNLTLVILGVTVVTDVNTRFDDSLDDHAPTGLTLATLAVGNLVEVSGLFDAAGTLHATFIEAKRASAAGRTFEITGNIAGLSGAAPNQAFTVNGVTVTTDVTTQLKDLPAGGLANGQFVEVKTTDNGATLTVHATRIEGTFEDPDLEVHAAQKASVEGFVKGLTGASPNFSFTLSGTAVTTSSATVGVSNVTANAHVQAEGPVVNGVIQAQTVALRP